jgi:hypothetical protein
MDGCGFEISPSQNLSRSMPFRPFVPGSQESVQFGLLGRHASRAAGKGITLATITRQA